MKEILDYLLANDLHNVSENIEIAKGKHELVTSFKDVKNKIIRGWKKK
tara:strand:+ start:1060 stop:1203 length:144 start_codon:yes stop_codon:yes gene_type:complete